MQREALQMAQEEGQGYSQWLWLFSWVPLIQGAGV